jgi:hypothetical protein
MALAIGTTNHPAVGKRVELPAWSDQWMRGARTGTVARVIKMSQGQTVYLVRCDNPRIRRLYRHFASNFRTLRA